MEPMDLDPEETLNWQVGYHQSNPSSNISDMDVDTSPTKYNQDLPESWTAPDQIPNNNCTEEQSNMPTVTAVMTPKKGTKTSYGIPEDDQTFSHFPEKGRVMLSSGLVHRKHSKSATLKNQTPSKSLPSHSRREKPSCIQSCCSVILSIVKVIFICGMIYLAAAYFLNLQKEKCRQSRHFDSRGLKTDLETLVFGQHFASEIIPSEMDHYFSKLQGKDQNVDEHDNKRSKATKCKPLVLSFHGWTGVGKNFISRIISDSFQHSMVNHIVIPLHFPHEAMEYKYGKIIQDWLVTNNTDCLVNVVIIDEMDKAFSPVTEGIIGAIEALSQPCHLATPTVILLLSNSYATDINRLFFQLAIENRKRDKASLAQFQSLFSSEDENMWNFPFDREGFIDAYVPFLPLDRQHVVQCIKRDLVAKRLSTDSETVTRILEELTFKSVAGLEISTTGCKRVADKVDYVML
ncbi:hypothetical protein EGW08_013145, partial [Elysia chlorotica]